MKLQFESTSACNARCTFCPRYDMTRPMGSMSDELFHKIIKEGKELKVTEWLPFLNGEPFIFPRIWQWLDYMKDNDCRTYLFTNAEFIDVDRIVTYSNIRYICCSINSASKETHAKVMRGPNYDVVKKNIEELIANAPFKVWVSMVVTSDNEHEVGEFKKIWGKRAMLGEFKNWGGARHDKLERMGTRVPCVSLLKGMTILWDGRVVPCCLDYDGTLILGDANTQSLKEIWQKSKWIRERHNNLDFSMLPCRDCNQNIV